MCLPLQKDQRFTFQEIGCLCSCSGFVKGDCIALNCIESPGACWVLPHMSGSSHILIMKGIIALFAWPALSDVLTQTTYNISLLSKQVILEDATQWWIHDSSSASFGSGLFQVAFSLAVVVYHGRRLSLALQAAISTMVTACVQKQMDSCQSESMALPSATPVFGQASSSQGAA